MSEADERKSADDSLELAVFLEDGTLVFPLGTRQVHTIGRGPENDIRIDDSSVSRRHAILHRQPEWWVEDLGSANGTRLRRMDRDSSAATDDIQEGRGKTFGITIGDAFVFGSVRACLRRTKQSDRLSGNVQEVVLDPAMNRIYEDARRAARADLPILLLGETGVGKEVLARYIHEVSRRNKERFVVVHVAALGASVLEAELFGYEKGAFTGAVEARPGLFESAQGGTVMLDEVGEIPLDIQVKLLRVLEERMVLRIGARSPKPIDVRFIAATHRDLRAQVRAGTFREDLYFRLEGFCLTIPPLRQRIVEIRRLASHLLAAACRRLDRSSVPAMTEDTWRFLEGHDWPGNVRELRNVMERIAALGENDVVNLDDLPRFMRCELRPSPEVRVERPANPLTSDKPLSAESFRSTVEELDRQRILNALAACGGNQSRAAEMLGVSRRTLINRLEAYGLARPRKNS